MTDDPWTRILQKDEVILWQGKPREAFYWRKQYYYGVFGAFVALFFVLANDGAAAAKLMVLALLPLVAFGSPVWDGIKRHYSFFTLTNRRGIVGLDLPVLGRRLHSHTLSSDYKLSVDHSGSSSAVYFSEETQHSKYGKHQVEVGFEGLTPDEADEVHRLVRETLKGKE